MTIQVGNTVKFTQVTVKDGYDKTLSHKLVNHVGQKGEVTHISSSMYPIQVIFKDGVILEVGKDEVIVTERVA